MNGYGFLELICLRINELRNDLIPAKEKIGLLGMNWELHTDKNRPGRCFFCGNPLQKGETETEHVIPKSRCGTNSEVNLVVACKSCNRKKFNHSPIEWLISLHHRFRDVSQKDIPVEVVVDLIARLLIGLWQIVLRSSNNGLLGRWVGDPIVPNEQVYELATDATLLVDGNTLIFDRNCRKCGSPLTVQMTNVDKYVVVSARCRMCRHA
jgi:hypothetical protein